MNNEIFLLNFIMLKVMYSTVQLGQCTRVYYSAILPRYLMQQVTLKFRPGIKMCNSEDSVDYTMAVKF